jgi:hypothetical protein
MHRSVAIRVLDEPQVAGDASYPLQGMLRFLWRSASLFSTVLLRTSIAAGWVLACGGMLYLLYVVYLGLWSMTQTHGSDASVALRCALAGTILTVLGGLVLISPICCDGDRHTVTSSSNDRR